jgi:hypothetical protein
MGIRTLYCYSVYDRTIEEYVLVDAKLSDAHELLKIPKDKVVQYSQNGYVLNKQYIVSRRLLDGEVIEEEHETFTVSEEFKKDWDEACLKLNPKARGIDGSL